MDEYRDGRTQEQLDYARALVAQREANEETLERYHDRYEALYGEYFIASDSHAVWVLSRMAQTPDDTALIRETYCWECPSCGCWVLPGARWSHGRLHYAGGGRA